MNDLFLSNDLQSLNLKIFRTQYEVHLLIQVFNYSLYYHSTSRNVDLE